MTKLLYNLAIVCSIVCTALMPASASAQVKLSREGTAHLKAAETLKGMMQTADDKLQVAEEYEKVTQSDPTYAPAFLEAARLYSELTQETGTKTYDKAKKLFQEYARLRPSEAAEIDADLIVLDAMLKKYNNGPTRVDGIWRYWGEYNHKYTDYLEVSGNGSSVKLIDPTNLFARSNRSYLRDANVTVNGNQCEIIVQVFWDDRPVLREKGWTNYINDCNGDADPGFPRSGKYEYNESLVTWYYTVDLSKTPLVMKFKKIHTDYYLNGSNTYSDTNRNRNKLFPDKELEKK